MLATRAPTRSLLVRVVSGDITRWRADAIATSANAGLCGNLTPSFWRFRIRNECVPDGPVGCVPLEQSVPYANVDGQVHAAAGPELQAALDEIARTRSVVMSGGGGPWRGSLLPRSTARRVACPAGLAVRTPSFGALSQFTDTVIHVVAPDGRYARHWSAGAGIALLRDAFAAALAQADEAGAESVGVPSIGCGVNGWPALVAARAAFGSIETWVRLAEKPEGSVHRLDFVMRGAGELAAWRACAHERFGQLSADGHWRVDISHGKVLPDADPAK